jgi:hypothetical protein
LTKNVLVSAEVDIGGCDVAQVLMVAVIFAL